MGDTVWREVLRIDCSANRIKIRYKYDNIYRTALYVLLVFRLKQIPITNSHKNKRKPLFLLRRLVYA